MICLSACLHVNYHYGAISVICRYSDQLLYTGWLGKSFLEHWALRGMLWFLITSFPAQKFIIVQLWEIEVICLSRNVKCFALGLKIDACPGRLNQISTFINRPGVLVELQVLFAWLKWINTHAHSYTIRRCNGRDMQWLWSETDLITELISLLQLLRYNNFHLPSSKLRKEAQVIQQLLPRLGRYNSVHVRRNDFRLQYKRQGHRMGRTWSESGEDFGSRSTVLYRNRWKRTQWSRLPTIQRCFQASVFSWWFPVRGWYQQQLVWNDWADRLQCQWQFWKAKSPTMLMSLQSAERFIGTELSTFTAYIHRLRGYMSADVAPDKHLHFTTDRLTGYEWSCY